MQHLCHLVFEIVTEKCEGQTDRRWSKKVNPECLPYYAGRHKNVTLTKRNVSNVCQRYAHTRVSKAVI